MAREQGLPQPPDEPPPTDARSSFAVWCRTTMLGDEDDADPAETGVVLRGID